MLRDQERLWSILKELKTFIDKGFQALILLPEIALTNQFSRRFKEFFGAEPAIWHSGTTKKNKSIIWKGITEGKNQNNYRSDDHHFFYHLKI